LNFSENVSSRFDMVSISGVIDAVKREAGNKQVVKVRDVSCE